LVLGSGGRDARRVLVAGECLVAARPSLPVDWHVVSVGGLYWRQGALLIWHPEGVLEFSANTF
jgi:hypothetical protein